MDLTDRDGASREDQKQRSSVAELQASCFWNGPLASRHWHIFSVFLAVTEGVRSDVSAIVCSRSCPGKHTVRATATRDPRANSVCHLWRTFPIANSIDAFSRTLFVSGSRSLGPRGGYVSQPPDCPSCPPHSPLRHGLPCQPSTAATAPCWPGWQRHKGQGFIHASHHHYRPVCKLGSP